MLHEWRPREQISGLGSGLHMDGERHSGRQSESTLTENVQEHCLCLFCLYRCPHLFVVVVVIVVVITLFIVILTIRHTLAKCLESFLETWSTPASTGQQTGKHTLYLSAFSSKSLNTMSKSSSSFCVAFLSSSFSSNRLVACSSCAVTCSHPR